MRFRADPLWPVLMLVSAVATVAVSLEAMARHHGASALHVSIPTAATTEGTRDLDDPDEGTNAQLGEPVDGAHRQARALARRGQVAEALATFAKLIERHPNAAGVRADHGYWLIKAGRPKDAEAELERAAELAPDSALVQLNLGAARRKGGDAKGAESAYRRALELRPGYIEAELALAQLLIKGGKLESAHTLLTRASERGGHDDRARALLALGRLQLKQGDAARAEQSLERAVERMPASAALRASIARAWLRASVPGSRSRAAVAAERGTLLAPRDASLHTLLGRACEATGDVDHATDAYHKAIELEPGETFARRRLLRIDLSKRDFESAERHAAALLKRNDQEPEHHFLAGLVAARAGRAGDARRHYEAAIERADGNYPEAYFNLGLLERHSGALDRAAEMYEKAIEQRPKYVEALNNLGVALAAAGRDADARHAYQQALKIRPKYASAWINLAELEARQGAHAAAVGALKKALEERPDDASIRVALGAAQLDAGDPLAARSTLKGVVSADPRNAEAWATLARVALAESRLDRALEFGERALTLAPDSVVALRVVADARKRRGRLEEAARGYGALLDQHPGNQDARLELADTYRLQGASDRCQQEARRVLRAFGNDARARSLLEQCSPQP